jgi:hypothetical protein
MLKFMDCYRANYIIIEHPNKLDSPFNTVMEQKDFRKAGPNAGVELCHVCKRTLNACCCELPSE